MSGIMQAAHCGRGMTPGITDASDAWLRARVGAWKCVAS